GSNPGLDATIIDRTPAASPVNSKETRVGTAPPVVAAAGAGAKETRIGPAPGGAPQPPPVKPQSPPPGYNAQQHQVRPQAGSKKWIYIAGVGIAAVVFIGVLVAGGAFYFLRGNGGSTTVKPAALADKPAAPEPQP